MTKALALLTSIGIDGDGGGSGGGGGGGALPPAVVMVMVVMMVVMIVVMMMIIIIIYFALLFLQISMYATGFNDETPFTFTDAIPSLKFHWSSTNPHVCQVQSVYALVRLLDNTC